MILFLFYKTMKIRIYFFLFLIHLTLSSYAQSQDNQSRVYRKRMNNCISTLLPDMNRIDSMLKEDLLQRTQCGLMVYDLTADTVLLKIGERMQMRPASVMKTLTATTALHELGGAYCYTTSLYMTGKVKRHILQGDLYIKGGYDPVFGTDDMAAFIHALKKKGIRNIAGTIYADVSLKDTLPKGSGWCWDDPDMKQTPLLYQADDVFMDRFLQELDRADIVHSPYWHTAVTDSNAVLIGYRNHSINQILMRMLKESDNTYAESLFYQLGAMERKAYPSMEQSAQKVRQLIADCLGMDTDYCRIADGSGLSLYNYLTPLLIVNMLKYVYHHTPIWDCLYPALPIAGCDGTLAQRMTSGPAYNNVHAKTGTVTGVNTLAGYCTAANGHILAFAIFNQGQLHSKEARNWQDRFLQILLEQPQATDNPLP